MAHRKNRRQKLLAAITILSSLLFAAGVAELILRTPMIRKRILHETFSVNYFVPHTSRTYDIAPSVEGTFYFHGPPFRVESDKFGCISATIPNGKPYVLVVGDSVAWGYAAYEEKWTTLIQNIISEDIINCGVPGYTTYQELDKAREVIARIGYPPKIIILQYTYFNDLWEELLAPSRIQRGTFIEINFIISSLDPLKFIHKSPDLVQAPSHWLLALLLEQFVRQKLKYFIGTGIDSNLIPELDPAKSSWLREAWRSHLHHLQAFSGLAQQIGAKSVAIYFGNWTPGVSWPMEGAVGESLKRQADAFADASGAIANYSRRMGRPPDGDTIWANDGHPSPKGQRLMAAAVVEAMIQGGLVVVTPQIRAKLRQAWPEKLEAERSGFGRPSGGEFNRGWDRF
jgi:lysophospholipase L1-like esterase